MDEFQKAILRKVAEHDGQTIADATRDLLVGYTTHSKIRYHVEHLAKAGLIEVDRRIKGRVFVSLTKAGKEAST